jgi:hypothetical protein
MTNTQEVPANCKGSGRPLNTELAIIFGIGRCPACGSLVTVDDEAGTLDPHEPIAAA